MQEKIIAPFIEATKDVFFDFFHQKPVMGTPQVVSRSVDNPWDISGIIGLTGQARGAVVISFKETDLERLVKGFLKVPRPKPPYDHVDVLGEMVNIIAGNAKKGLEDHILKISLPSVVHGKDHNIRWPEPVEKLTSVPFKVKDVEFVLIVGLVFES